MIALVIAIDAVAPHGLALVALLSLATMLTGLLP